MGISWVEIAALGNIFNKRCEELGIRWIDKEVKEECFNDFISQYEDGNDVPDVRLLGYGYEKV